MVEKLPRKEKQKLVERDSSMLLTDALFWIKF